MGPFSCVILVSRRWCAHQALARPDYGAIPDLRPRDLVTGEIAREDGRLVYRFDGREVGATAIDPGPLTEFWFSVSCGDEESWDVHIDDLQARWCTGVASRVYSTC